MVRSGKGDKGSMFFSNAATARTLDNEVGVYSHALLPGLGRNALLTSGSEQWSCGCGHSGETTDTPALSSPPWKLLMEKTRFKHATAQKSLLELA